MVGRTALPERIFVAYVNDQPGVLTKIASTFFRRGINIVTLTVSASHEPGVSKMVIRTRGDVAGLTRLARLIENHVDVLRVIVTDPEHGGIVELCLARVAIESMDDRDEVLEATSGYRPRIVLIDRASMVLELISTPVTIDHFVDRLRDFPLIDISRTGVTTTPSVEPPLDDEFAREASASQKAG